MKYANFCFAQGHISWPYVKSLFQNDIIRKYLVTFPELTVVYWSLMALLIIDSGNGLVPIKHQAIT